MNDIRISLLFFHVNGADVKYQMQPVGKSGAVTEEKAIQYNPFNSFIKLYYIGKRVYNFLMVPTPYSTWET